MYSGVLAVVPLKSALGDWFSDHVAVSAAAAALGSPLPEQLTSRDSAAMGACSGFFAGRVRSKMAHCTQPGVVCNPMGRVVYFSTPRAPAAAPSPAKKPSAEYTWRLPGVYDALLDVLQLPWLVAVDLEGSGVVGRLPDMQELPGEPVMVRLGAPFMHLPVHTCTCIGGPRHAPGCLEDAIRDTTLRLKAAILPNCA